MLRDAGTKGLRLTAATLAALVVAGCHLLLGAPRPSESPDEANEWGPLAVVEGGDFGMDAGLGPGRLRIGRRCVTEGGTTLVWSSGQTRWDEASGTIEFNDRDLGPIVLRDGMAVRFGGGDPDVLLDLVWLAPLSPSCPDAIFLVSQVMPEP